MLITELKSKETIEALESGKVFIINCHGCKEIRFPEKEAEALQQEMMASGKVMGSITTDYICNQENLELRLEKHLADIRRTREELREVFGRYVREDADIDPDKVDAYFYDFSRAVDFPYPVPSSEGMNCQIEFMQPGNTVQVPVNFVKRITVRREELYD